MIVFLSWSCLCIFCWQKHLGNKKFSKEKEHYQFCHLVINSMVGKLSTILILTPRACPQKKKAFYKHPLDNILTTSFFHGWVLFIIVIFFFKESLRAMFQKTIIFRGIIWSQISRCDGHEINSRLIGLFLYMKCIRMFYVYRD